MVHSILYDDAKGRATGVRVIDAHTHAITEYRRAHHLRQRLGAQLDADPAQLDVEAIPERLGQRHGLLGHYVAFHNYRAAANGTLDGLRGPVLRTAAIPTECILANFRNLGKQDTDFVGGYTTFTGGYRTRGEPAAVACRRRLQGRAGAARAVGTLHVHAGRDRSRSSTIMCGCMRR